MIHGSVELHNVVELEPSVLGGQKLSRYPTAIRRVLTPLGQVVSNDSSGCEIRFVTEGDSFTIHLSLLPAGLEPYEVHRCEIAVFNGDFFHSMVRLQPGIVSPVQIHDLVGAGRRLYAGLSDKAFSGCAFCPGVWRFQCGHLPVAFHGIDAYGTAVRPPNAGEKPSTRMLCYGSSITHGASPTMHHLSYVYQAGRRLGFDVLNQGLAGSCMCEPEVADYLAARDDWDVITLELGVNMRGGYTPDEFRTRVRYLLEQLIAHHPDKPKFLITIYPNAQSLGFTRSPEDPNTVKQADFDGILEELHAELAHAPLHLIRGADILGPFSGLTRDILHPSDFGHTEMGLQLAQRIAAVLAQ